jgi:hypothetical protein
MSHSISRVVTSAVLIRSGMVDDVSGLPVRADEEAVVAGSVISVGALEVAAAGLLPGREAFAGSVLPSHSRVATQ